MKILEAQSAQLTNYEVYKHLNEQKERHKRLKGNKDKGRRPGNLETVVKEVCLSLWEFKANAYQRYLQLLEYLIEAPSPLGSHPFPYNENTIRLLLEKLREFKLTKAEIIMIMNLRPTKPENLNTIIEEMEYRFPEEAQQEKIVSLIAEVLGTPDGKAEKQAMTNSANVARKEEQEQQAKELEQQQMDES
jgi:hypothetical protein